MKILLIHPLNTSIGLWEKSIVDNFKFLGHIPISIDYRDIIGNRFISKGLKKVNLYNLLLKKKILITIEKEKPDFVFVSKGELLTEEILFSIKSYSIPIVNWIGDGMWLFDFIKKVAPYYDYLFSFDNETVKQLNNISYSNAEYLPFGFDTLMNRNFNFNNENYYKSDICFIGSPTPERVKMLNSLSNKFYKGLKIWGPKTWSRTEFKYYYQGRVLKGKEMYFAFSRAKIVLNIHYGWENNNIPFYSGINHRVFETGGIGAFSISNYQNDMALTFKKLPPTYDSFSEMNEMIKFYLDRENLRKDIALEFKKEILERHTLLQRLDTIIQKIKKL